MPQSAIVVSLLHKPHFSSGKLNLFTRFDQNMPHYTPTILFVPLSV